MKFAEDKNWYKVGEVCQMVERSIPTINVWYDAEAYALENGIHFPFYLPKPRTDLDKRGSRYWTDEDVQKLKRFRDSLMRGDLAFYTKTLNRETEASKIAKDKKNFREEHGVKEILDEL